MYKIEKRRRPNLWFKKIHVRFRLKFPFFSKIIKNLSLWNFDTSFSSSLTFLAFCLDLVFSCSISALSSLFLLDSSTILVAATSPAKPVVPKQTRGWGEAATYHLPDVSRSSTTVPAKATRSSSLFFFRRFISKSLSLTSLKRRLFTSLSSLSCSSKSSICRLKSVDKLKNNKQRDDYIAKRSKWPQNKTVFAICISAFDRLTSRLNCLPAGPNPPEAHWRGAWLLPSPFSSHVFSAPAVFVSIGPEAENYPAHHHSPWSPPREEMKHFPKLKMTVATSIRTTNF